MSIEFTDEVANTIHEYLLWSLECDAKGWEEFSKDKCREVPFHEALWAYSEEIEDWMNAY